ncbi:MAG: 8-amino-7-oxononanoate synthase [Gammaproteobacteria bacterium]|nr:MAG: 8-amino-7-oxononanoate synthase [Gammaproteobacteria bacterium]
MTPAWLDQSIQRRLEDWRSAGLWRIARPATEADGRVRVHDGARYVNFSGNDYLGLAHHPKVKEAVAKAVRRFGWGSTGSHLVTGHYAPHDELEAAVARLTGCASALLFSTGYMANLAIASVVLVNKVEVLADRLVHASIIDGLRLSQAKFRRYRHLDMAHLAQLLEKNNAPKIIWTDGVFSMDGDCAPLPALVALARAHDAALVVDDAHGIGVLGDNGGGLVEAQGIRPDELSALTVTFGKALGGFGAAVAGPVEIIEALRQFARPYIYTTALPVPAAAAVLASIQCLEHEPELRQQLRKNIEQFTAGLTQMGRAAISETAIQPIVVGCEARALKLAEALAEDGLWVPAIRPPTVPKGAARLRITLSAQHRQEDIERLLTSLWQHRSLWRDAEVIESRQTT